MQEPSHDTNTVKLREHLEKRMCEIEQRFEIRISAMETRFKSEIRARDIAVKLAHDNAKQTAMLWAAGLSIIVGIVMKLVK